jgi:hypothetical protein
MKKTLLLLLMAGAGYGFADEEGIWAGRGGGYEIGNSILWQDGTTTRRVGWRQPRENKRGAVKELPIQCTCGHWMISLER